MTAARAAVLLALLLCADAAAAQERPLPRPCIDLNTAAVQALEAIVHVGPVRAAAIGSVRAARPFGSVQDLLRIDGIGPARLEDIARQGMACVAGGSSGGPPPPRPGPGAVSATSGPSCVVGRVIDGDTLECADGRRVRLLLIDAPERSQPPFGAAAATALEALAPPGTPLGVETDVARLDRYERLLAYLHLPDGRMVNEALLGAGLAVVSVYPPNVRHVDRFRAVADSARQARAGLWAIDAFACLPADHRAGRC